MLQRSLLLRRTESQQSATPPATEIESVMSAAWIRWSPLAIGAPLVGSWGRLDDFARPGLPDLFQASAVLRDPVSLGSGPEDRRKAVLVADLDRQPAAFVYVDVEAQAAVSADAGCLAWSQAGQLLLPGVQVMLEEVKVEPGVDETRGGEYGRVQDVVAGQHGRLEPLGDAHDAAIPVRISQVDKVHRSGLGHEAAHFRVLMLLPFGIVRSGRYRMTGRQSAGFCTGNGSAYSGAMCRILRSDDRGDPSQHESGSSGSQASVRTPAATTIKGGCAFAVLSGGRGLTIPLLVPDWYCKAGGKGTVTPSAEAVWRGR